MHGSDSRKACDCRNVCNGAAKEVRVLVLFKGSFGTDRCTCGTDKQPGSRGSKLSEKLEIAMEEYLPIFHSPTKG